MKKLNPEALKKIILVDGDLGSCNLGLSASSLQTLTKHISVVFHCAATVRFNEPLKDAISINVYGTIELVRLCKKMQKLEVPEYFPEQVAIE